MSASTQHPPAAWLEALFTGDQTPERNRIVVRHLLTGCISCRQLAHREWQQEILGRGERQSDDYESAFRAALAAVGTRLPELERHRREAPELAAELLAQPPERQLLIVGNRERYRTFAVGQEVLEVAYRVGSDDPPRALALATTGLAIAERLDPELCGERLAADLRARAWATLGNARRICSDLAGAAEALETAATWLERGTGDPLESARCESFRCSLALARRDFGAALDAIERAIGSYRALGDRHLVGKAEVEKSLVYAKQGRTEQSTELMLRAVDKIDSAREPRVLLMVEHNLTADLIDRGRLAEAAERMPQLAALHEAAGKRLDRVRFRWLEGRLAYAEGKLVDAEEIFAEVRDRFVDEGIAADAALATLHLAQVLFDADRHDEVRERLEEAVPVLQQLGITPDAMAAVVFLRESIARQRLTAAVIGEAIGRLAAARGARPGARAS